MIDLLGSLGLRALCRSTGVAFVGVRELMDDQSARDALRRQVYARYREWILSNRWQCLGDLAKAFPEDVDIAALTRLTGRIYKLYYLIEDVEGPTGG